MLNTHRVFSFVLKVAPKVLTMAQRSKKGRWRPCVYVSMTLGVACGLAEEKLK